ncbi:MAG: 2-oxoacid:acceptor oxidoreductase family protein [Methanomassiliicoccales archaeon]|nr:MAG: 2-oxoacid:acceptor oxidoreductase family protein [Methanomassiliicoccales archaeon]
MFEIRFHGRGGQGAVMAAQTIAEAAVNEGLEAQAFPHFGAERRGAPVMAFARIDTKKISVRTQVYVPDMLVVMDESLLDIEPVADGLKDTGSAVINTSSSPENIDLGKRVRCVTVDATTIALETLKAPIVNTAILGAMAKADPLVSLGSIKKAIISRFGEHLGEKAGALNAEAAQRAYEKAIIGESIAKRQQAKRSMWLPTWQDMPAGVALHPGEVGGMKVGPGSAVQVRTGTWRTRTPRYIEERCVRCVKCWFICPDAAIHRRKDDRIDIDYDHCKGCGICSTVCPARAIEMVRGARL